MVHLFALGVLSHSIVVWSQHFADALLRRTSPSSRAWQTRRLMLLHLGVLVLVVAVPARWWWPALFGALAVSAAVCWHGVDLARQMRGALPTRLGFTVRYYLAACACLPLGAGLGTTMVFGLSGPGFSDAAHARLLVAHTSVNILGWVGLTVLGTLTTLWPTMLRTRMLPVVERIARLVLPVLGLGVVALAGAAWADWRWLAIAGLAAYTLACAALVVGLGFTAWKKPPAHFSTYSAGAGLLWLVAGLGWALWRCASAPSWAAVQESFGAMTTVFVLGFAVQVLFGALSYLLPSVLGGGPGLVRAGLARTGRWGLGRVVVTNVGLVVCLAGVPSLVRVTISLVVFLALAAFLPLALWAIIAGVRAKRRLGGQETLPTPTVAKPGPTASTGAPRRWVQVALGLLIVALAAGLGVAGDPAAAGLGTRPSSGGAPTGHTTRVQVSMADMRFTPSRIEVPPGDRLVIELVNSDPNQVHDLVMQGGVSSGRMRPGQRTEVDAGVITASLDGWCSVAGHRQMGMTLRIVTSGPAAAARPGGSATREPGHAMPSMSPHMSTDPLATSGDSGVGAAAAPWDPAASPAPGWQPRDASLPPLPPGNRTHRVRLPVTEQVVEVAPGVRQTRWMFGGSAPGPTLHGHLGDRFEITLVNDGSIGHSIDFHAGALAPDQPMRTIAPGQSLTYRFTATRAGIWMYHCSTMPMSLHIANGMFGAVVIEPPDLPAVARSYVLVQSEIYPGNETDGSDPGWIAAGTPRQMAFNGYANQYAIAPLAVPVGQPVRVWVLAAGPNRGSAFHVVGGQFSTVYKEGAYLLRNGHTPGLGGGGGATGGPGAGAGSGGSQVLDLAPAQGGFVELLFPEPGHYPFVTHAMSDAERGAKGIFHAQ